MSRLDVAQRSWLEPFDAVPTDWTVRSGPGTESIAAVGSSGNLNNVYQSAGYTWRSYPLNIKLDSTKLYRIRIRARRTATTDAAKQFLYCGVEGVAADGVTLVNIAGANDYGSQHYFAASAVDLSAVPLNEWREYVGYFRGWGPTPGSQSPDPTAPGHLHPNVRFFRPLFIVNYNAGPVGNVTQVDGVSVEMVDGVTGNPVLDTAIEVVHLVEVNFSGGSIYLNTGAANVAWNGFTWQAVGGALTFGGVEEGGDSKAQGVDLTLSGVDQTVLSAILTNDYRGRVARIWRAEMNSFLGTVRGTPVLLLEGLQSDHYELQEDRDRAGGTVTVKTRITGRLGLERLRGVWSNLASHQHIFSGDTFFQHTATLAQSKVYWGTTVPVTVTRYRRTDRGFP